MKHSKGNFDGWGTAKRNLTTCKVLDKEFVDFDDEEKRKNNEAFDKSKFSLKEKQGKTMDEFDNEYLSDRRGKKKKERKKLNNDRDLIWGSELELFSVKTIWWCSVCWLFMENFFHIVVSTLKSSYKK